MLEEKLSKLYLQGESTVSLSKKFGLDSKDIWTLLRNQGVKIRSPSESLKLALRTGRLSVKQHSIPNTGLTTEKAYLLGVLCGDGYMWYRSESPHQTYQFALQACDKDFVDEFSRCIMKAYGIKPKRSFIKINVKNWQDRYLSRVCSKAICEDLEAYLPNHKTRTWRVPENIKGGNSSIKAAFIRGFFDSEGSLDVRRINATSTNLTGLEGIKSLLSDLSIRSSIIMSAIRPRRSRVYNIRIQDRKSVETFADGIGLTIGRKKKILSKMLHDYKLRTSLQEHVKSLEPRMKELRRRGLPYENISQLVGLSIATVWKHSQ